MSRACRGLFLASWVVLTAGSAAWAWVAQPPRNPLRDSPTENRLASLANGATASPSAQEKNQAGGQASPTPGATASLGGGSQENKPAANAGGPAHEPLFEGWPKPKLALIVTGCQHGYIEPCGCTGLANQKGGLARRHSLIQSVQEKGWPVACLDVGNQVRRVGKQAELKFQYTLNGLGAMNYQAITFGPDDLRLTIGDLAAATSDIGDQKTTFCAANVSIYGLTPTFRVFRAGGMKIGVTGILSAEHIKELGQSQVECTTPEEGLKRVLPRLAEEKCSLLVLLAHAPMNEARALARRHTMFDLVITSGDGGEPTYAPEAVPGAKTLIVQSGDKGMYAGVVGIFQDPATPVRYQRVPLDDRFPDSPAMLAILKAYQDVLKRERLTGLGVRPIPHPSGDRYVGTAKCGECHATALAKWQASPHSHGTDSLVNPPERSDVPRHFDPECLSCHVTGWNPQKYYPYATGYVDLEESKHLHGVGCENCHGPGERHADIESGNKQATTQIRDELRQRMRLPLAQAEEQCRQCHDLDNSPDFDFKTYWPQIEHVGKD